MKKLLIGFLLLSSAAFAECESVDLAFAQFTHGSFTSDDLSRAIECRLKEVGASKSLCATHIGIKQDQLRTKQVLFDGGLISILEVREAQAELDEVVAGCE